MTELEKLKLKVGITDTNSDDLLGLMLEDAENKVLDYTNREEILDRMLPLVRELAEIYYNRYKEGADENISSMSEGEISVSYSTAIPEGAGSISSRLKRYRIAPLTASLRELKSNESET